MTYIPASLARRRFRIAPIDVAIALVAPPLAFYIRDFRFIELGLFTPMLAYSLISALMTVIFGAAFGTSLALPKYVSRQDVLRLFKMSAAVCTTTYVVIYSADLHTQVPRSLPVLHFMVSIGLLFSVRITHSELDRRLALKSRKSAADPGAVLLVGATPLASLFIRISSVRRPGTRVAAVIDETTHLCGRNLEGHPIVGTIDNAASILAEYSVHGVFIDRIVICHSDPAKISELRQKLEDVCRDRGISVEVFADYLGLLLKDSLLADSVRPQQTYTATTYLKIRWCLERVLAGAALILLSPIILVVGAVVMLDIGLPVIFWQQRVGQGGAPVLIHKFRTLRSPLGADGRVLSDAERLSIIGRFLRATRLDELPQLIDVLQGHISIIGPRPLLPVDLPEGESIRLLVRPGLTGWAQVHGGKTISAEDKNALDEWYIAHASPLLDLKIAWLTLQVVLRGDVRNADAIAEACEYRRKRLASDPIAVSGGGRYSSGSSLSKAPQRPVPDLVDVAS